MPHTPSDGRQHHHGDSQPKPAHRQAGLVRQGDYASVFSNNLSPYEINNLPISIFCKKKTSAIRYRCVQPLFTDKQGGLARTQ
ncbi:hypothetical protein [Andreprevotia lacus]|jgi:hypothetical protein|uniref:hypothetical protein n=1 Tax=Andreprevotia lacus TaxID=1121000 RepID=UPI00111C351A|nr:hypothetical protein [Andreprevotia lacus]